MARIKIEDLPKEARIGPEELKRIRGGALGGFLKIEPFAGECTDHKHENEMEILALDPIR